MTGSDVAAVRTAIDAEIRGRTLCDLFARNAEQHGARPALRWRTDGTWQTLTWADYHGAVSEVGMGLRALGVAPGERVALMLANRPEHLVADGGVLQAAATAVPLDPGLTPEAIAQVARDAAVKVAVVDDGDCLARWQEARDRLPELEQLVLVDDGAADEETLTWDALRARGQAALATDPGAVHALVEALQPDTPAAILYAPGETPARGVVVTHRNVLWELASLDRWIDLPLELRTISHEPPTVFQARLLSQHLVVQKAGSVAFCTDPADLVGVARAVRPQLLAARPETWGALRSRLVGAVEADPNERRRRLGLSALEAGRDVVRSEHEGERVAPPDRARRAVYERLVYAGLREEIGLEACDLAVSVDGALPAGVEEFFAALGLPVHEAYGLAETTGLTHMNRPGRVRAGTVGEALPGVEVRLTAEGELVVRGGNVTGGYLGDEEATQEAIDEDGWLHTGDLGTLDADGYLTLTARRAA